MSEFAWSPAKLQAAQLVAEDRLTNVQIAAAVGCAERTLHNWKAHPAFMAKADEIIAACEAAVLRRAIAQRSQRVEAKQRRWLALERIISERATDEEMQDVPGGTTGLITRQFKMIGYGETAELVREYVVDTGLLSEMRQLEKEAAQELGQWTEKREQTGEMLVRQYLGVDPDEV